MKTKILLVGIDGLILRTALDSRLAPTLAATGWPPLVDPTDHGHVDEGGPGSDGPRTPYSTFT